jgi:hypothetical protein
MRKRKTTARRAQQHRRVRPGGSICRKRGFEPLRHVPRAALPHPTRRDVKASAASEGPMEDEIARAARARKGCPFLSTEQAAFYLGLSARKLQAMRADGTGPRFRRHSRYVRYHVDDLDAWSKGSSSAASGDA